MAKVFVIDDDDELLMMVGMILRRAGFEISLTSDAVKGLDKIVDEKPDVVILDLMMPYMSGFDVCRHIRATPEVADTPVMILTARMQPGDRQAAFEAGANDYVTKPVTSRQLVERVEALLTANA